MDKRLILYNNIVALTPLWVSVFVIEIFSISNFLYLVQLIFLLALLIFYIVSILLFFKHLKNIEKKSGKMFQIKSIKKDSDSINTFIFTYTFALVTFFGINVSKIVGLVLFMIFIIIILKIAQINSIFYPNLVLLLNGYKTYICEIVSEEALLEVYIITRVNKSDLSVKEISLIPINDEIKICVSK